MATDKTKAVDPPADPPAGGVSAQADAQAAVDAANALLPDQRVLGVAAHLTAWRETYGDDVMDAAVKLSADQAAAAADARGAAERDSAAAARAAGYGDQSTAPVGRSTAEVKSKA